MGEFSRAVARVIAVFFSATFTRERKTALHSAQMCSPASLLHFYSHVEFTRRDGPYIRARNVAGGSSVEAPSCLRREVRESAANPFRQRTRAPGGAVAGARLPDAIDDRLRRIRNQFESRVSRASAARGDRREIHVGDALLSGMRESAIHSITFRAARFGDINSRISRGALRGGAHPSSHSLVNPQPLHRGSRNFCPLRGCNSRARASFRRPFSDRDNVKKRTIYFRK